MTAKVLAHILLWNSCKTHGQDCVVKSIQSLSAQEGFKLGDNLDIVVSDNASEVNEAELLQTVIGSSLIKFQRFNQNFGFSGAYNIVAKDFIERDYTHFLLLNADCCLKSDALKNLLQAFKSQAIGMVTPKLLQDNQESNNNVFDSTGIVMTTSLRHFDRAQGELDKQQYDKEESVFGGTGACLLISKDCVKDLIIPELSLSKRAELIHATLKSAPPRVDLLDEAFFAYREDADLAWRAQRFGWQCVYVPSAIGFHRRVVTPEKRQILDPELNRHGVRNRFLLQLNNYSFFEVPRAFLTGFILRNIIVILAVIIKEHTSLRAFKEVFILWNRALERRRYIFLKTKVSKSYLNKWFK